MTLDNTITSIQKKTGFDRLGKREKIVVGTGLLFVVGFLVFIAVIGPYLGAKEKLERSLLRKEKDALEMTILKKEYQELKSVQGGVVKQIESRNPGFSLFSYLEKQASTVEVKNRVTYMKPSTTELDDGFQESAVEMKMEQVTLAQLVDFLVKVESIKDVVVIKRIAIQKNKRETGLLDVVISIFTIERTS
jgi:general secretion pathway protein M